MIAADRVAARRLSVQAQPSSCVHAEEQPSPEFVLSSSQDSLWSSPSPQTGAQTDGTFPHI